MSSARGRAGRRALALACLAGTAHALVSLYWGLGGQWLVETLGQRLLATFQGLEWVLLPVGVAKLAAAWVPLLAEARHWPARRAWRALSWLGAVVLVAWGGLNTVVGNLVLAGVIVPDGGFDRPGMVGHAYLWDPLFTVWGVALVVGLVLTRQPVRGFAGASIDFPVGADARRTRV